MHFPPPIRIAAPLLALVFGLGATWLEYRLNMDLDLSRHVREVQMQASANARRVAKLTEKLLPSDPRNAVTAELKSIAEQPEVHAAAVVDGNGVILADNTDALRQQPASKTRLASVAALINNRQPPAAQQGRSVDAALAAYPFKLRPSGTGWVLLEYDLSKAIADTQANARTQLRWMASAMALLSFALWAVLHFWFAARLARLAGNAKALGEGKTDLPSLPGGSDEVGALSKAFANMAGKLQERAAEQLRLEREVLEISESERRRIGHDLHDDLGQRLTAASMSTNALISALKSSHPELAAQGEEIGRQLRDAIAETRALSHGLAPVSLVEDGLTVALGGLAATASRSGVRCVFDCAGPVRISDAEMAGHLYRIAQEAVNNALKHASASEIRIGLEIRPNELLLEVDDDGIGWEEPPEPGDGIGLRVMRYRAHLMGAELSIGAAPAGGSRISCSVPLSS